MKKPFTAILIHSKEEENNNYRECKAPTCTNLNYCNPFSFPFAEVNKMKKNDG